MNIRSIPALIFTLCALFFCGPIVPASAVSDDTASLQAQFDSLTPGATLTLVRKTYRHSAVLKLRVSNVVINGNGATLLSTNDPTSSVQVLAPGVTLRNLNLSAPLTGARYDALDQHKLVIGADSVTVENVTITGSAAAGVFVNGAGKFVLNNVKVKRSRADGIHMTMGAHDGQVNNAYTEATGDDGISVVSYNDAAPCRNITVTSPVVNGTTWGRGISVVGGEGISYRNILVQNSNAAGIYVATESGYHTTSVNGVEVTGGTLLNTNVNPSVVHGAVMIYAGNPGQSVSNVKISNLVIAKTPASATRNIGIIVDQGTVSGVALANIQLWTTTVTPIYSNAPKGAYTATSFSLNGKALQVT